MTINFQALHSPRGANAHFALGLINGGGGFGLQSDRAATNDVFIGWKRGNQIACFPFFRKAQSAEMAAFVGEQIKLTQITINTFRESQIERGFGWATDTWSAPRISFSIVTPVRGIAFPQSASWHEDLLPALTARLTLDNRDSAEPLQGFFAVSGLRGLQLLQNNLIGWQSIQGYGFACRASDHARAVSHWDLPSLFTPPHPIAFPLAGMGAILVDVPAHQRIEIDLVLGWYLNGVVTAGAQKLSHAYARYYTDLADVLSSALDYVPRMRSEAEAFDRQLIKSGLNSDRQFMIAQATRSYWASTMLFDENGREPRYVVNEGSFMMLNTLDLAVDHIFYELDHQPWVVRNILDHFADEYSYADPCGISFTHDQGAFNTFAPRGNSSYEVSGQEGCYAFMTQEQLMNWVLCAGLYAHHTRDRDWADSKREVFARCYDSMLERDHPRPSLRDGIMDIDSARAGGASEITTYDSLDPSLGRARRNVYLAVKGWGTYLALAWLFDFLGDADRANAARASAERCADTVVSAFDPLLGYIPALLDGNDQSPIIPAVEGLIYPHMLNIPLDQHLIRVLRDHLTSILKPGVCLFVDGGWKLSAHSNNSWMSKIFLAQYVAENILGIPADERADQAHAAWWQIGCASNPGIDQIFAGTTPERNFFYPRAITSYLWLKAVYAKA